MQKLLRILILPGPAGSDAGRPTFRDAFVTLRLSAHRQARLARPKLADFAVKVSGQL